MQTIRTHNPGLRVTLRAIAICLSFLAADFAAGVVGITRLLWGDYLDSRRDQREFEAGLRLAFKAAAASRANPTPQPLNQTAWLDESAIESLAREFGRPAWLWVSLLAAILLVVIIDIFGAWGRIGAAITLLARG